MPQNAAQKTWPTQPIPSNGAFTPHGAVPAKDVARVKKEAVGPLAKVPVVVAEGAVHAAAARQAPDLRQRPAGRRQLAAGELQREDAHDLRLLVRVVGRLRSPSARPYAGPGKSVQRRRRRRRGRVAEASGTFTAIDATSGKTVWQKTFPEPCYAGTATTAGGLVFVGRNAGRAPGVRRDAAATSSGASRPAPARTTRRRSSSRTARSTSRSSPAATRSARRRTATASGSSASTARSARRRRPATGTRHRSTQVRAARRVPPSAGDATAGKTVFANNCVSCHGATGHGGNGGPDLTTHPEREEQEQRRLAGAERRRRHAGVQGPADVEADRRRRHLRDAADHEQEQVMPGARRSSPPPLSPQS